MPSRLRNVATQRGRTALRLRPRREHVEGGAWVFTERDIGIGLALLVARAD